MKNYLFILFACFNFSSSAQSFNDDKTSFSNFLKRMYSSTPFEGVKVVDDYDHQYYEKGLNFNQEYNKEQQVNKDHAWPSVYISQNHLKLAFVLPATGTVKFLRSSSSSLDKTVKFRQSESEEVNIPIEKLLKGKWNLEIEWVSNQKSYLYKQDIFIR